MSSGGGGGGSVMGSSGNPAAAGASVGGSVSGGGGGASGSSTGSSGASSTGGGVTVEPQLITSGKDDYWKVGALTRGGTSATVTVKSSSAGRTWDGFGGTFNEAGWKVLMGLDSAKQTEIMRKLFDVTDGIGFTWGRIPIGPSDYAIERYSFQESASAPFSIEHDKTTSKAPLMSFIKAALAVKRDIKFWGSPWTPPPWMKTGASTAADSMGYDKGSMNKQFFDQYADYLVNWIKAYEAEGIKIDFIVPQNEPGWAQAYPSCAWGSYYDGSDHQNGTAYLGDFVTMPLSDKMSKAGLTTDIWYGTFSNKDTFADYWANLPADHSKVKGVALQWATDEDVKKVLDAGFKVMQSEHKCGNYPWLTAKAASAADATRDNFFAEYAPNNHAYGEESWDLIKSWIDKGVTSYSAWNMVLDKGGWNLDLARPWPQNALIVVDGGTIKYTAAYYVFRHVAEYVDPGATVLTVTDGNALAFKNPDGAVVTIMYNSANQASTTTLSIDGTLFQVSIPAHGWATVNYKA
ncbi:MAG TPA: glycoside hydrolase [Polyangiaceae bacterium]|nr:glycoside hydrolase [Polyangiaceae bacterium]